MGFLFRTYRWLYIFSCQLTLICGKNLREGAGVLTEDGLKMFRKAWFCLGVELQRQIWNSFSLRFLISKGGLGNKMWLARGVFLWKPNSGCQLWFGWVGGVSGGGGLLLRLIPAVMQWQRLSCSRAAASGEAACVWGWRLLVQSEDTDDGHVHIYEGNTPRLHWFEVKLSKIYCINPTDEVFSPVLRRGEINITVSLHCFIGQTHFLHQLSENVFVSPQS